MIIKALIPFSLRDAETGDITSIACGAVVSMDSTLGNQLISDGLAVESTEITPTGTITLSANGTYDVSTYASATVNVGTLTVTYDVNGGTGSATAQTVIAGNSINLDDGTGITPDTGKVFDGWATTSDATEPDVTSPYTPTENITLYAVYKDE